MGKHICVTVDGTPLSLHALPVAASLADQGDRVEILTAVEPIPPFPIADYVEVAERWVEKRHRVARKYLDREKYEVVSTVLLDNPALALVEYLTEHTPDVVVLATHGRGPISRSWIGSTADRIIRSGLVPTMVVRPAQDEAPALDGGHPISRVLVPLDGSTLAEKGIRGAVEVLGDGIELVLLRVIDTGQVAGSAFVPDRLRDNSQAEDEARAYLDAIVAAQLEEGRSARGVVRVGDRASLEIVAAADSERCDAIAMATHGRGGLARIALGSVTDKVLRTAPGALLVVPGRPATA